jgi:NAD dependent epimerase/dehydratase family enzyme
MSWIARDDLVRLIVHAMATPSLEGAVNGTAPAPERNGSFARALGRALRRPAILPLPAAPLRLLGGDFAKELLLGGQRVLPTKALTSGFTFRYPRLDEALRDMTGA